MLGPHPAQPDGQHMPSPPPRRCLGYPCAQRSELLTEHNTPHGPLHPTPLAASCPQLAPSAHQPPRSQAGHRSQRREVRCDMRCERRPARAPRHPDSPRMHDSAAGVQRAAEAAELQPQPPRASPPPPLPEEPLLPTQVVKLRTCRRLTGHERACGAPRGGVALPSPQRTRCARGQGVLAAPGQG